MRALVFGVFLIAACGGKSPPPRSPATDPAAGRTLLVDYQRAMADVAMTGGMEPLEAALTELDARAVALRDQHKLSADFYTRYARVIHVTRVLTQPATDRSQKEVDGFVRDVSGHPLEGEGIAAVAPVLVEELLNLHLVLDPKADREALRRQYFR